MKKKVRLLVRNITACLLAFGMLCAACGGGGGGGGSSDSTMAPPETEPAMTAESDGTTPEASSSTAVSAATSRAPGEATLMDAMEERGVVRVGIQAGDFPPFIYYRDEDDYYAGFEGTMARLLIAGTMGPIDVEYVRVGGAERFSALESGTIDMLVRMTTVTPERREQALFTTPYLMDGPAVMVPVGSGITEIDQLAELHLAVQAGSSMRTEVGDALAARRIAYHSVPTSAEQSPSDLVDLGQADGYIGSWSAGINRAVTRGDVTVIPIVFNQAIAVASPSTAPEWNRLLDERLAIIVEAGVWAEDFEAVFGFPPPWTLEQMAAAS